MWFINPQFIDRVVRMQIHSDLHFLNSPHGIFEINTKHRAESFTELAAC
jgi:hypothetical protein